MERYATISARIKDEEPSDKCIGELKNEERTRRFDSSAKTQTSAKIAGKEKAQITYRRDIKTQPRRTHGILQRRV